MAPRLFGTDGVRGHAGQWPLDPATVRRLGASMVRVLGPSAGAARLLIGRDTRESGTWIERELAYGASLSGATVIAAGVLPTPAVAYLTRSSDVTLGAIISASHNPFEDNGIKVFSGGGQKFTEELERRVEQEIADTAGLSRPATRRRLVATDWGPVPRSSARGVVRRGCLAGRDARRGLRQRRDHKRGAGGVRRLGFEVDLIGASPDGRNINLGCGSTHPEAMARAWWNAARWPGWPSMATATAQSSPTSTDDWSMATP